MKHILLTDNKTDIYAFIVVLIHHGYDFEYRASSTSLIIEVLFSNTTHFALLLKAHDLKVNPYVS